MGINQCENALPRCGTGFHFMKCIGRTQIITVQVPMDYLPFVAMGGGKDYPTFPAVQFTGYEDLAVRFWVKEGKYNFSLRAL